MWKYLLEKEFKQFFRNRFLPKLVVVFPVMVMLVLPWVTTMDVKGIRITVTDRDRSALSERLADNIGASDYFRLERVTDSYADALRDVEYGTADVALEIPPFFEKELTVNGTAPVQIAINTVNGTRGLLGGSFLGQLLADFSRTQLRNGGGQTAGAGVPPGIEMITQYRYNPTLDYRIYMVPALMVILLIVLGGFLPALNIVSEKEQGTIEQINVTPVPRFLFIFAKLTPYWLMGIVVLSVSMALAGAVYGLWPSGSVACIYLVALLFILAISGFGLVISNYASTMQQALFVMFFFVMIFQLMSGLLTPIRSMPEWAQWLTALNPPRYFIHAMRLVYLKGGTFADLLTDCGALLGFAVFFNSWAVWSYRKRG
ncbi:MAG: ABC transporter permease [Tannerella sp.]|nr:ABC transporter permease [Tannerella sp.]